MYHLKRFRQFESDSWAGSLYAYDKTIPGKFYQPNPGQDQIFDPEETTHYTCNDCGLGFYAFSKTNARCKYCSSKNVKIKLV
jgi:DNA-directed RNA polymerase subunit RPC12/RpoP